MDAHVFHPVTATASVSDSRSPTAVREARDKILGRFAARRDAPDSLMTDGRIPALAR